MIESGKDISINGVSLYFQEKISTNGYVYSNSFGDGALFTLNDDGTSLFGSIHTHDGRSYDIEKCERGHVWKESDQSHYFDFVENSFNQTSEGSEYTKKARKTT